MGLPVHLTTDATRARQAMAALHFYCGHARRPQPPRVWVETNGDGSSAHYVRIGDFGYRAPGYLAAIEGAAKWLAAHRAVAGSWRAYLERA